MSYFLLGTQKNGCLIDDEKEVIEYYELLSLYEKMQGQHNCTSLSYKDIDYIDIGYALVNGVRMGSATISLSVHCLDGNTLEWPLYFALEEHQKYVDFAKVLLESKIQLHDEKRILENIAQNPTEHIGTLLFEIDKKEIEEE